MPEVIDDVRFPDKILRGASGGASRKTRIGETNTGYEQRNKDWSQSRRRWTVARKLTNRPDLDDLIAFWECRDGRHRGFLFRDPSDFYVGLIYVNGTGFDYDTPVEFGIGDNADTTFQLVKLYTSGGRTVTRTITRPLYDGRADAPDNAVAVKIFFDEVEQVSGWTLNYATGVVTFSSAPGTGVSIGWCGMFDVPVRFDSDDPNFAMATHFNADWSGIGVVEIRE